MHSAKASDCLWNARQIAVLAPAARSREVRLAVLMDWLELVQRVMKTLHQVFAVADLELEESQGRALQKQTPLKSAGSRGLVDWSRPMNEGE